jgi:HTH-type transcriptional regulator/antitoxin HigA
MSTVIKPIKTDTDYEAALEQIDTLFDAAEGTDEANLRDVLVLLVENYEEKEFPIDLPDAISAIKFRMDQENLTQRDLIPLIGSRSKVSEVLSGKRSLNIKMIRSIHKHLKIPAEVLLKENVLDNLDDVEGVDFDQFPILEMIKFGAFRDLKIEKVKSNAEELIRGLFNQIGFETSIANVKFRKTKSTRLNSKINPYALQGWILHLLYEASKIEIQNKYKTNTISNNFITSLVHLSYLDHGPQLAQEFLLKNGIILLIVHHYKNTYLDGAAYITPQNQPIIGLTLRYDRLDNFWFNLLHELGHIKLHLTAGNYIADDMSLRNELSVDKIENEADEFAEHAFFPKGFELQDQQEITKDDVIECSRKNQIHPAIIAGKIQYQRSNYRIFSNLIGRGLVREQFQV